MAKSNKYINNFMWRLMENWGSQVVSLIVTMILARLLDPDANGTVAIVTVLISLCSLVVDSGFGMALVQKQDADDLDFSSVFYLNIVVCIVLYLFLYAVAPWIAHFYEIEVLTDLIRIQGLVLVLSGIRTIQTAYISKHMLFKKSFFVTFSATLISAVTGIWMAYEGYGVWALVCQSLVSNAISAVALWITVDWRPKLIFSFGRVKSLFSYGSKLLLSSLMFTGYADLRQLIIGKIYSTADLAYYNKASNLPNLVNKGVSNSLASIIMPAMSEAQNDPARIKAMLRRTIRLHSYILVPIFVGMLSCAEPLIVLMFSEKWLPSVDYLQIFCLTYVLEGIGVGNQNAIKGMGRSDITLKIECIKTPMYVAILLATVPFGVKTVAWGFVVGTLLAELLCAIPSKKLFDYSLGQQLLDICPNLLLSAFMGICVWGISLFELAPFVSLLVQVPTGVAVYVVGSIVMKNESFYYVLGFLKGILGKICAKKRRGEA